MKCYRHHDQDAVGQCKHCYKGLCAHCAADTGHGLACKGEHEKDVEFLNSLIENSKKAYSASRSSIMMSNLFLLVLGVLFIGFGYYLQKDSFLIWMGVAFIGYWVALAIYNSAYFKKIRTNYDS